MEDFHESEFISKPAKFFQTLLYYGDWAAIIYLIIKLREQTYEDVEGVNNKNYTDFIPESYTKSDIPIKENFFFWLLIITISCERFFNLVMIGLDQTSFNMFNMKPYVDSSKKNSSIIK